MSSARRPCRTSIRSILAYGAVNPGNDASRKELFTAQIVLTCTPLTQQPYREDQQRLLENVETLHCFEVAAEFDMGNSPSRPTAA